MAKRSATSELNHDNWDAEDEIEEAGHFTSARGDQLKNRVIRKAKRSLGNSSSGSDSPFTGNSPFAKFSGFSSASGSSPFMSFKKIENSNFNNPFPVLKTLESKPNGNFIFSQELKSVDADSEIKSCSTSVSNPKTQAKQARAMEYYRQLQSLNEGVLKWMQLHLAKNACSDFTPVFNDYKKHMDSLNVTYPVLSRKDNVSPSETKDSDDLKETRASEEVDMDTKDTHSESPNEKQDDETDYGAHFKSCTTNTSTFSFGCKLTPTATSSISPLGPTSSSKHGAEEDTDNEKKDTSEFSFGYFSKANQPSTDKPFSFAVKPVEKSESELKEGEYEPPKPEFVAVSEDDALYSKRCKLFFKKEDSYSEKGVGTLYLKSLEGKTQLLIRADTNLGNILLNIMLSASLPMSRTGKNNVLLVCIPNPPVDAKNPDSKEAIPVLIRVKTTADADELLETLNKYKS